MGHTGGFSGISANLDIFIQPGYVAAVMSNYGRAASCVKGFFNYFATRALVSLLQQRAHGSGFDTTTRDTLAGVPAVVPTERVVGGFESVVGPLVESILKNVLQSKALAALRDVLLPELISGDLRVKYAETLAENIT